MQRNKRVWSFLGKKVMNRNYFWMSSVVGFSIERVEDTFYKYVQRNCIKGIKGKYDDNHSVNNKSNKDMKTISKIENQMKFCNQKVQW